MSQARKTRRRLDWDEWYMLAVEYRDTYGDLLVPMKYRTPSGFGLGRWIEGQRARYNHVPSAKGPLEGWQIDYLNRIGMVWKLENRYAWDRWLEMLDAYAADHGDIDIPFDYEQDGFHLGNWLRKQRMYYSAGELSPKEIDDLEARGINWSLRTHPRSWDDWFADAAAYYREHADLMVPADYETSSGDKLGTWIYQQRDIYMGRKKGRSLSQNRIDQLNSIGMVWEPLFLREDAWEQMFQWVSEYKKQHGHLPTQKLKAPDGRSMGAWLSFQRMQQAAGKLPKKKLDKLNSLGLMTDGLETKQNAWEQMFRWVSDYTAQHGELPLWPHDLKAPDGRSMYGWIRTQRSRFAKGKLSQDQIDKLNSIGMTWSPVSERSDDWEQMYTWVAAFVRKNRKLPPRDCAAPDGRSMGGWIKTQRSRMAHDMLSKERKERLIELGIYPHRSEPNT